MEEQAVRLLPREKVVVVLGKIGSGKSTALNNIYGLNLTTKSSPRPVTTEISELLVQSGGDGVKVIDTPGLGGVTRSADSIVSELADKLEDKDFTVVYCLPVKPSDTLTETDRSIVKAIDYHLGRRVWDKCVLLLTFSDKAKSDPDHCNNNIAYIKFLDGHVMAFYNMLKQVKIELPVIQSVFGNRYRNEQQLVSNGQIVAIPVAKSLEETLDIVPEAQLRSKNWAEEALLEINETSALKKRKEHHEWTVMVRKNPLRSATGTLLGTGVGALIGAFTSPWGIVLGAFIGAALGIILAMGSIWLEKIRRRTGRK